MKNKEYIIYEIQDYLIYFFHHVFLYRNANVMSY